VQPLGATVMAIDKRNDENKGFFRPDADLALVVISNKDEYRDGDSSHATKPEDLLHTFYSAWPQGKKLWGYAVVIAPDDEKCLNEMKHKWPLDPHYGRFAHRLAQLTGGKTISLCSPSYTDGLADIADLGRSGFDFVDLREEPVASSVEVEFDPVQTITWSVSGKRVQFAHRPNPGTRITIRYQKK
jgi:hypothetical protein